MSIENKITFVQALTCAIETDITLMYQAILIKVFSLTSLANPCKKTLVWFNQQIKQKITFDNSNYLNGIWKIN